MALFTSNILLTRLYDIYLLFMLQSFMILAALLNSDPYFLRYNFIT